MSRLPLFPLGTVLVPTAVLPLHIFEPRYRGLMDDLAEAGGGDAVGGEFGVVLIERGSEVGGGDSRLAVGTVARILEATRLADGRWIVAVVGTRRFEVERWLPDDPYPLADVAALDDGAGGADGIDDLLTATERKVRRALAMATEAGEPGIPVTFELDREPLVAAWQLAALVPVSPFDRQELLELGDPAVRLRRTAVMADGVSQLLALHLGGAQ